MEQKEPVLVLYDREEEYARLFSEYLKRQKELPWQIHTYTRAEELLAGAELSAFISFPILTNIRKRDRCGRNCWRCM